TVDGSIALVTGTIIHGKEDREQPARGSAPRLPTSNIPERSARILPLVDGPEFETEVPGGGPSTNLASYLDELIGLTIQTMRDAGPDATAVTVPVDLYGQSAPPPGLAAGLARIVNAVRNDDPGLARIWRVNFALRFNPLGGGPARPGEVIAIGVL